MGKVRVQLNISPEIDAKLKAKGINLSALLEEAANKILTEPQPEPKELPINLHKPDRDIEREIFNLKEFIFYLINEKDYSRPQCIDCMEREKAETHFENDVINLLITELRSFAEKNLFDRWLKRKELLKEGKISQGTQEELQAELMHWKIDKEIFEQALNSESTTVIK